MCDVCPGEFGSNRSENGHASHPAHTSVSINFPRFFFEELMLCRVPRPVPSQLFFASEAASPSLLLPRLFLFSILTFFEDTLFAFFSLLGVSSLSESSLFSLSLSFSSSLSFFRFRARAAFAFFVCKCILFSYPWLPHRIRRRTWHLPS